MCRQPRGGQRRHGYGVTVVCKISRSTFLWAKASSLTGMVELSTRTWFNSIVVRSHSLCLSPLLHPTCVARILCLFPVN